MSVQISPRALLLPLLALLLSTLGGCLEPTAKNPPLPPVEEVDQVTPEAPPEETREVVSPGLKVLSSGGFHTCAVRNANHTLYCWGRGSEGQIGNNALSNLGTPTRSGSLRDWLTVDGGRYHNCGIRAIEQTETIINEQGENERIVVGTEQTLWCWGDNSSGQIGEVDGNGDDKPDRLVVGGAAAVDIPLSGWTDVSAGGGHSCAIHEDGATGDRRLYCWGGNRYGQSADPTSRLIVFTPRQVDANIDWTSVSAGGNHTCAIRKDNADDIDNPDADTLWCWGDNTFGQLGVATAASAEPSPQLIEVGGVAPAWKQVAAAERHTCAIQSDGTLWCWGDNSYGQLGQGDTVPSSQPLQVGLDSDWRQVSAFGPHTCAVKEDDSLWCWGNNVYGQLGIAEVGHQLSPTRIDSDVAFVTVTTGQFHTCALDSDNDSHCWGLNAEGQLGIAAIPDYISPAQYNKASWKAVASGEDFTCGIKEDDSLWCGGINGVGQLGDRTPINRSAAVAVESSLHARWRVLRAGRAHACAIASSDDSLWCWGSNDHQQLGTDANQANAYTHWLPAEVAAGGQWLDVAPGLDHTCALRQEAAGVSAWCWGDNRYGQTTSADPAPDFVATQVQNGGVAESDWVALASGDHHTCGIRETSILPLRRELYCWGRNHKGQLGQDIATVPESAQPLRVGTDADWVAITAGANHTCGIRQPRTAPLERIVLCWGDNGADQTLANDTNLPDPTPTQVGEDDDWVSVVAGPYHTCGLRQAAGDETTLFCWGNNNASQVRKRTAQVYTVAVPSSKGDKVWSSLAPGTNHTCAISTEESDGVLLCWGLAAPYQLGNGDAWRFTPVKLKF